MKKPRKVPAPFVKWAGGKTKMLPHIMERAPKKFHNYFEPFIGGGAVFFELIRARARGEIDFLGSYLGDNNAELVNAYQTIKSKSKLQGLKALLEDAQKENRDQTQEQRRKTYLNLRSTTFDSSVERASRFIRLNRTCFNGLYRVNSKGGFNVPFGKYSNPLIFDEENLNAIHEALNPKGVETSFHDGTFEKFPFDLATKDDFVYFDPPYFPISSTSNFTGYTSGGFGIEEHMALSSLFARLANNGVAVIMSNSSAPEVRGLYKDFEMVDLIGSRCVGGPAEYRKSVREVMILANVPAISKGRNADGELPSSANMTE